MIKVGLTSLGCAKNLVDSEVMLGLLKEKQIGICDKAEEADVLIVNTCGFIREAQEESIEIILQLAHLKRLGKLKKLIVTGCLVQQFKDEIAAQIPEVDAFLGVNDFPRIAEVMQEVLADRKISSVSSRQYIYDHKTPRVQLTPSHYAYIKISEGCSHQCSFCMIPAIKGKLISRDEDSIVSEARGMIARGVKELILIAQDTTEYGRDRGIQNGLASLLRRMCRIEGDFWIRVLYTYPSHWTDELIELFASEPKICKYVDIPIQHIDDEILQSMRRGETRADIESLINKLRSTIPDLFIRSAVIVGYPGESEEQFLTLLEFIKKVKFERLGAFTFSAEKGTEAERMKEQTSEEVKIERFDAVMEAQRKVALENNRKLLGKRMRIIADERCEEAQYDWVGRTYGDAPEVDGVVYLNSETVKPGDFVDVEIVDSCGYDLVGKEI